jgi:hypothetical protein
MQGQTIHDVKMIVLTMVLGYTVFLYMCVISTLLHSLFTHNCVAMHASNTTVVGLITTNDEPTGRR